jgi:hypothetical protein
MRDPDSPRDIPVNGDMVASDQLSKRLPVAVRG